MADPFQLTPDERRTLLHEAYAAMGSEPEGRLLVGGEEATILWRSTIQCFVHGLWVPTILCAQATCERTLAGIVALRELPGYGATAPRGWERWGLGAIIKHVREQGWVPTDALDDVDRLCEARKPWGHWRLPFDVGTIGWQVADTLDEAGGWGEDPAEVREQILSREALRASTTTLRLYLGNYGMGPFDT